MMIATADPAVHIEAQRPGYVRYAADDGRRWEVRGRCVKLGHCLVGAVIDGEYVATLERARELAQAYDGPDVSVGVGFSGCCDLEVRVL